MKSLRERLEQHGLAKYAVLFAENSIDLDVLAELTDADLKELEVPLGDRRRILKIAAAIDQGSAPPSIPEGREAERRQLTVMFTDLVDSTKLAARLDPEDMQDLIGRYQKAVAAEVVRFGGYVAKPLGDGLLIYFGWPQAHEDDAERAVRSAMASIEAVQRLSAEDGTALATRIGIATGEVVVGDFTGAGVDESGAVVGGTPNLAARLQAVAGSNAIVVSEKTMKLIGRHFILADLGEQELKGFDKPAQAWRVDGERASQSRFDAMHGARLGAFVGRMHEIGMLLQRWEVATEGECQLVLIVGEAGIGKSRLVAECLNRVGAEARRIAYQGSPLHANTALYPVVRQLQSRARFGPDDTAAEKWSKLDAALPGASPWRRVALQLLAELMSLPVPNDRASGAKAGIDEQREAAPLLIIVEDAHWLDATTQEFIERLLDRLHRCPAMVLVTYRPEFEPPWAQHANVGLLSLSRLGKRDARAIVDSLLSDGQRLPTDVADDIIAKGDGIPLFVQELTGSVLEAARATGDQRIQIPTTLRDAMSERLDRLGSAKEVAQIASAFGREFSADLVAATLDRSEDDLQADLDRLIAINVVFQSSRSVRRYTFHHALLQEAAYESMLKSKRREVHARIAEVLTRRRPEMMATEPEVLATHFAGAGDTHRAAEYWRKAGHIALRTSAYREAMGSFKNALPLIPPTDLAARIDTNRAIASAYFATGDYKSMREYLEHAATDAEATDDQVMLAEIIIQQGHVLNMYGGSLADAAQFGERALKIATRLDDDALAYGARFCLGQTAWIGGNFITAIRLFTANLPENLRDPERVRDFGTAGSLMIDSMSILGSVSAHCGEFERAQVVLERAIRTPTLNSFDVAVTQFHLNRAHLHRGDAATALPLMIKAMAYVTEVGLKFVFPWHRSLLGHARVLSGEREGGISDLQRAIEECEPMHLPHVKALASVFLAEALVPDKPDRALEVAEAGLSVARVNGFRAQEAELLRVKASALALTDWAEAAAPAKEGLTLARQLSMKPEEGHALRVLGDIMTAAGENSAARDNHGRARAIYEQLGMAYWLGRVS